MRRTFNCKCNICEIPLYRTPITIASSKTGIFYCASCWSNHNPGHTEESKIRRSKALKLCYSEGRRDKRANIKTRQDDKRGKIIWTKQEIANIRTKRLKYKILDNKSFLENKYLIEKLSPNQIAKEIGCGRSNIVGALNYYKIPHRNKKEAAKRGSESPNWRGGHNFRLHSQYKEWRLMVFGRDNYTCQSCEERGVYLEAHHILPCRDFPEKIYDVDNGITLCQVCHGKIGFKEIQHKDKFSQIVASKNMEAINVG